MALINIQIYITGILFPCKIIYLSLFNDSITKNTDEKKSWPTGWKTYLTSSNTTNYRINTDTAICLNVLVKRNQLTEKQLYTKATLDFPEDQTRLPTPPSLSLYLTYHYLAKWSISIPLSPRRSLKNFQIFTYNKNLQFAILWKKEVKSRIVINSKKKKKKSLDSFFEEQPYKREKTTTTTTTIYN